MLCRAAWYGSIRVDDAYSVQRLYELATNGRVAALPRGRKTAGKGSDAPPSPLTSPSPPDVAQRHRLECLDLDGHPQSCSASRVTAGASGFLALIQSRVRPHR